MKKIISKANTDAPSNGLPYGSIRDRIQNVQAGTPVNTDVYSDMHQFFQHLMNVGRVNPNGELENATNGFQIMDAFYNAITSIINPNVSNQFTTDDDPSEYNGASLRICYGGGYYFRAHSTGSKSIIFRSIDGVKWQIVFQIVSSGNYTIWDIDADDNGNVMAITSTNKVLYSSNYGATFSEVVIAPSFNDATKQKRRIKVLANNKYILTQSTETRNLSSSCNILIINSAGVTQSGTGNINLVEVNDIAYNRDLDVTILCCYSGVNFNKIFYSTDSVQFFTFDTSAIGNDFISATPFTINGVYNDANLKRSGFVAITNNAINSSTKAVIIEFVGTTPVIVERDLNDKNYFGVKYGNGRLVLADAGGTLEQSFNFAETLAFYNSKVPASTFDLAFGGNKFIMCGGYASTPLFT